MSYSKVDVANLALQMLGASTISDINEPTREASLVRTVYEICKDDLLKTGHWAFAIKRISLAPLSSKPAFDFEYEFNLPSDCIKVIETNDKQLKYKVEDGKILADVTVFNMRYVARVAEGSFTADFAEVLAAKIASKIAYSVTASSTMQAQIHQIYEQKLATSRSIDSQQGTPRSIDEFNNSWLDVRY